MAELIDLHAHFLTDEYLAAARAAKGAHPDGVPGWPSWNLDAHLAFMDRNDVRKSILSISSPGVHFGDDAAAAALSEHVNDAAAEIRGEHPSRFGFFASLPLPDVDAAVRELRRAIDLGAAGVVLESNIHGRYLGDADFEPIYAELERRGAILFIHPTSPPNAEKSTLNYPRPMLEFPFETTRTVVDLLLKGVLDRHPALRIVVPHGGATLPLLMDRVDLIARSILGAGGRTMEDYMRHLWFDTAGSAFPRQMPALLAATTEEHIVYGTDYCWTPEPVVETQAVAFGKHADRDWPALTTANARHLLAANER